MMPIALAMRTGWTLEYVRSLDMDDYLNIWQYLEQQATVSEHNAIRARERSAHGN